jgi:hypothetical protein
MAREKTEQPHAGDRHVAALEADTGAGWPLGWSVAAGAPGSARSRAAIAALGVLVDMRAPLGAGNLEAGGAGADVGPLVAAGVLGLGMRHDMSGYWRIHHTEADTLDKIDPRALGTGAAVVAVTAWVLAELPVLPSGVIGNADE